MEQWQECKKVAKKALLLFRMGDFYEAFHEDAELLSDALEITLTQRQEIPMSGIPYHTLETMLDRLINKGMCVAIAEQTEDPKLAKGLVKREVVRIVTPGTTVSSKLAEKQNNFIVAVTQVGSLFGIAACDLSTATFKVLELDSIKDVQGELYRLNPKEIVVGHKFKERHKALLFELKHCFLTLQEEWCFDHKIATQALNGHFARTHLDGFGLKGMVAAINAAGALVSYLKDDLSLNIDHIKNVVPYTIEGTLLIDQISMRNLELIHPLHDGEPLLKVIDKTRTPMGGRLLAAWLARPLCQLEVIEKRQEAIAKFIENCSAAQMLDTQLTHVRDLERLMTRIQGGQSSPRDFVALAKSLAPIGDIKGLLKQLKAPLLQEAIDNAPDVDSLVILIQQVLVDEPSAKLKDGHVIRPGFHPPLDDLREMASNSKAWIARYQGQIKQETGIKNLKVSFNRVFGYYIEVSKGQAHLMPATFDKRQTLANCERFISTDLKEYENKILHAEDQLIQLESKLFFELKERVLSFASSVLAIACEIAKVDVLLSLAKVASQNLYVRPKVEQSRSLYVKGGRHPVVEKVVVGETFVPNDTTLNTETEQLMLITGPNMAGKSTYIRQVALIVILAQVGSYVPADEATVGLVDKIFTRIGASDDLARGQSTFMVEMNETANILNNATDSSLVILDEVGRGTSTYDGVAIAQSVVEYLLKTEGKQARTLFATHYFELTELANRHPKAFNANVAVREANGEVLFLHKIVSGAANRSYGIYVAKLAGLPSAVISRAKEVLLALEASGGQKKQKKEQQLMLFDAQDDGEKEEEVAQEIKQIDPNTLTPLEAISKLEQWRKKLA